MMTNDIIPLKIAVPESGEWSSVFGAFFLPTSLRDKNISYYVGNSQSAIQICNSTALVRISALPTFGVEYKYRFFGAT